MEIIKRERVIILLKKNNKLSHYFFIKDACKMHYNSQKSPLKA